MPGTSLEYVLHEHMPDHMPGIPHAQPPFNYKKISLWLDPHLQPSTCSYCRGKNCKSISEATAERRQGKSQVWRPYVAVNVLCNLTSPSRDNDHHVLRSCCRKKKEVSMARYDLVIRKCVCRKPRLIDDDRRLSVERRPPRRTGPYVPRSGAESALTCHARGA